VAEEMLNGVVCSREQFSFRMCLESGDGSGNFCSWRQRVPDSRCRDTECFGLVWWFGLAVMLLGATMKLLYVEPG